MKQTAELILPIEIAEDPTALHQAAAQQMGIAAERLSAVRIRKRSLDARQRIIRVRLVVEAIVDEPATDDPPPKAEYRVVRGDRRAVVVGSGPAGLFAALRLIELDITPIVLERGFDVRLRRRDLARIQRFGTVNPDSNYCFGEGGAGTYSDGKLYTRSGKRGSIDAVLTTLVAHGAPPEILIDAHPHIGSNKLPKVVAAMRQSILDAGGQVHFGKRVVGLITKPIHTRKQLRGVITADGDEFTGDAVVLATGHSARDLFSLLQSEGIRMEAKPFAMGVRIEHPQPLIDEIQYHRSIRNELLPAASYRLATTVQDRGVFSFCMCPGGFIVPAATAPDEVVVNGMSLSRRDSPFANSGIVVSVEAEDLHPFNNHAELAGVAFQKSLEVMAASAGGGMQRAPAQRLTDFLAAKVSATLPKCSYKPGITSAPLHSLLPASISTRLQQGLKDFGTTMKGYLTEEAIVVGVESRTSSPVRIPRNPESLEHPDMAGLFPCGEGAGYAGGIVSAAMDGVRVATAVAAMVAG
ncbi:MAG: FAD-binding protein [Armatimonadetes bacterium]|nr:FAD-binding protein [Armatimonadota bacterium]